VVKLNDDLANKAGREDGQRFFVFYFAGLTEPNQTKAWWRSTGGKKPIEKNAILDAVTTTPPADPPLSGGLKQWTECDAAMVDGVIISLSLFYYAAGWAA
jgi:hypothetical protein